MPGKTEDPRDATTRNQAARLALPFFSALMLVAAHSGFAGTPTTGSVILFNTVCAQCHEMECSRRLSFSSSAPAGDARGHIQNYAGPQDAAKLEELFGLIEYTKTRCDYYAPEMAVPRDGIWSASDLAPLATPSRTDWFVPLGTLPEKTWVLALRLSGDQPIEIEIVNRLGLVAQGQSAPGTDEVRLAFAVVDAGLPHFLRLRSRGPIRFTQAILAADAQR